MPAAASSPKFPVPLVALAQWIVPGAGYLMLGQWARGLTIGITIIVLFVAGLLIGGVRVIEVPGWGDHGRKLIRSEPKPVEQPPDSPSGEWVLTNGGLWDEIRNKPWYIAQILAGPMNLAASWGSINASVPGPDGKAPGARSHARTNELGTLYTAVAGMLNLLAIIDSAHRAAKLREGA